MRLLWKSSIACRSSSKSSKTELISRMEKFIWAVFAGKSKITKVDELRRFLIKSEYEGSGSASIIKNIGLVTFPPPIACLEQHIHRANYKVRI